MKRNSSKEIKSIIVGAKFAPSLVALLDEDAEREGASRSYILRRIALQHYQARQVDTCQLQGAALGVVRWIDD